MLRFLIPALFFSCSTFAQDSLVLNSGDTLNCKILSFNGNKFLYSTENGLTRTTMPSSEVKSYYQNNQWNPVLDLKKVEDYQTQPDLKMSAQYLRNAGTGFGVAGAFILAGGGTLLVSSALKQEGKLTSSIPFYVGYGLLTIGGIATIGASVSLVNAGKAFPRVKLTAAGVPLN